MPGTSSGGAPAGTTSSGGASASGRVALDAQALCKRLIEECGQALAMQECVRSFGVLRVTRACADAIAGASCAQLVDSSSPVLSTCFPPCSGTLATCNADGTLTYCTVAGTTQTADCQAACVADGYSSWTGTCGTSHDGQVADRAQCWCE